MYIGLAGRELKDESDFCASVKFACISYMSKIDNLLYCILLSFYVIFYFIYYICIYISYYFSRIFFISDILPLFSVCLQCSSLHNFSLCINDNFLLYFNIPTIVIYRIKVSEETFILHQQLSTFWRSY